MTQLTNQATELSFTEYCLTYSHIVPEFSMMEQIVQDGLLSAVQKSVRLLFVIEEAKKRYLNEYPMQWGMVEWLRVNFSQYLMYPEGSQGVQLQFLGTFAGVLFECVAAHDFRPKEGHYVTKWYDKNGEETRCPLVYANDLR